MDDRTAAFAIADLPDSAVAAATAAAMTKTGAFTNVEVHQMLTQEQLTDIRQLERVAAENYLVPGIACAS